MALRPKPLALLVASILIVSLWACGSPPYTAYPLASTTLSLSLPNDPYLLVDSNNPASGPQVGLAYAVITNTGPATAHDLYMYIGDGTTPGTFAPGSDGNSLSMLGGVADATRFIVDLTPGQSKTVYWMLTYPLNDGETYPLTIWADSVEGDFVQGSHSYTVQSTISAAADKLLGTVTVDPPSGIVSVGNILTVTVSGFNLGTIGQQGDAWFQPVGNLDFSPDCFRLVRSEVYIHSIANQCGYGAMPYIDQLYFPGIRTCYSSNPTDYVKYYFVALQECTTTMKVYQKAASGAVQKYSGDFGVAGATLTTTSQGGSVTIAKSVSPLSGGANTTFTWTITFTNNSDYPVGDPQNGNGLVLIDEAIPANTTYVAGTANCSGFNCLKYYSTDNGATWNQTEPAPASWVNKLKWYINETIPAHSSGTVSFESKVNSGVAGTPVICNSASAQIDDGASLAADGVCANGGVDLELSKIVDDPTPCEGSSLTYTITVSNHGAVNTTNVQVTDLLPTGITYASNVPSQGSYNDTSGLWMLGDVNVGANATLLLTATVNTGTGGQIITNTGNITYLDQTESLVTNNSDHADIFVPSSVAAASSNSPVCEGSDIVLMGGPSGMTSYNWTGPNGFISSSQSPIIQNATASNAGTYYLTVTNGNCTGDPASTEVMVYSGPTAVASSNSPVCEGSTISLSGGPDGMASYNWTGPNGYGSSQQSPTVSTNATMAMTGTYTLTVTDSNGCTASNSTAVTVNAQPTADAGADAVITAGDSVVIGGTPTASGGTPLYTYNWSPTAGLNDASFANPTAAPAVDTIYTVTVIDSNGCTDSDDVMVTVTQSCCLCGFVYRAGTMEPLAGWQVILEKETNSWSQVGINTTDANGRYCFCGLGSGYYRVYEVVQSGWNQVSPLPNEHLVTLPGGCCDPVSGPFLDFENQQGDPSTVGWNTSPVDRLAVLAPWIALFAAIIAGASVLVLRRRRT